MLKNLSLFLKVFFLKKCLLVFIFIMICVICMGFGLTSFTGTWWKWR